MLRPLRMKWLRSKKAVESGSTVVPEPEPGQTSAEDDPIDAVRGMVYTTESNSKEEKYGVGNQVLKRRNST